MTIDKKIDSLKKDLYNLEKQKIKEIQDKCNHNLIKDFWYSPNGNDYEETVCTKCKKRFND